MTEITTKAETKPVEKKTSKKQKKTPTPRARKPEEIIDEVETKLTEKEKINLIKYLKANTIMLGTKLEQLQMNIESSREKLVQMEKKFNEMENYYQHSLDYVDKQTKAFADAISKATYGGLN